MWCGWACVSGTDPLHRFNPKLIAIGVVGGAHIGLAGLLSLVVPPKVTGGAPAILVTLEPVARFDGDDGAEASAQSVIASGGAASIGATSPVKPRAAAAVRPELAAQVMASSDVVPVVQTPVPQPLPSLSDPGERHGQGSGAAEGQTASRQGERSSRPGRTGGGGAPTLGAQAAPQEDRYAAEVIAWIESHKHHPGGGLKGVVGVAFVLDRYGKLRSARILRASGSAPLDQMALTQLAAMQPFPKPAPGARWARRDFAVAIDYRSR